MNKIITVDQYVEATREFIMKGLRETQRMGQYLCNEFKITDSTVFYETNEESACVMFYKRHVRINEITNS